MHRNALKAGIGFTFAIGIIAAFTWVVGWQDIAAAASRASLRYLALGSLVAFAGTVALGVAWWTVVRTVTGYGLVDGLRVFYITMFANSVTPLGQAGGEPFMAYLVSRDSGIPIEESFGAVLAADLLNTVHFFTLSFVGILIFVVFFPLHPLMSLVLKILLGGVVVILAGLLVLARRRDLFLKLLGGIGGRLRWLLDRAGQDGDGVLGRIGRDYLREKGRNFYGVVGQVLGRRRVMAKALLISHVAGLLGVAGLYLILFSLGVDHPFSVILFVLPAAFLAGYLPLPGGLGGIEVAMILLLTTIPPGMSDAVASAAALFFRLQTYWLVLFIGGVFTARLSVDMFAEHA